MTGYPQEIGQWPGKAGARQTAFKMRALARQDYLHEWIRDRAAMLIQSCPRHDRLCHSAAIMNWVRSVVKYIPDPHQKEALHEPVSWFERRLRNREMVYGDCDDMSLYAATLMKSIGLAPKFRIMGRTPKRFHHVAVMSEGLLLDGTLQPGTMILRPTLNELISV